MAEPRCLYEILHALLCDEYAQRRFRRDPGAVLAAAGLEELDLDDLRELAPAVLEHVDPDRAADWETHAVLAPPGP